MDASKKQIRKCNSFNAGKGKVPTNILKYLVDRPTEMGNAVRKVNRWLNSLLGHGIQGGTAIGKYYATLVLDIEHHGGEFYVNEEGDIKFENEQVKDFKGFKKIFLERYEITSI